jgi:hypothetical protein
MPSTDLTLAISLEALEELARPNQALEDAATWTSHVGIVSSQPSYIERWRVREAGYHQEYVFVGTGETSGVVKTVPEWTFRSVTDAATAADWQLATPSSATDDWP